MVSSESKPKVSSVKKQQSCGVKTRAIAIDALSYVLTRNYHADAALDKLFSAAPELSSLDRAFVFEMVYGSLRWLSKMDWILGHMIDRPFVSLDPRIANALRIGTYQIFYMDRVPDRAAVSETVEATRAIGASNAVSFVNAILRRVARKAEYFPKPDKETNPAEYLAMQFAHPLWLVERWLERFPESRVAHLLQGNNEQSKSYIRVLKRNPLPEYQGAPDTLGNYFLREFGITSETSQLKGSLCLSKYPPFGADNNFLRGCYQVQDEAAQLIATLVQPQPSDFLFDACAAPGGKTIQMWDEGIPAENIVVADNSQKRLRTLSDNFKRAGCSEIKVLFCDAAEAQLPFVPNKILVDAPCSSLGVVRRHPEIKWLRSPLDVQRCSEDQLRILSGVANKVSVGGDVIYSVCSNEKEETSVVIEKFLADNKNFEALDLTNRVHEYYRKYVFRQYEFSILPGNGDNLDGFYGVVLRRNS